MPSASAQACRCKARCAANSGSIGKQRNAADACLNARGYVEWVSASLYPPGHPATRPFGFAVLLGLTGIGRTRLCEPQTGCRSSSRQTCATRPRKRDETQCTLNPSSIWSTAALQPHAVLPCALRKTAPSVPLIRFFLLYLRLVWVQLHPHSGRLDDPVREACWLRELPPAER